MSQITPTLTHLCKKLPFRLGTTSYIIPADILPNVDYLKNKVQDIELVLFESQHQSNIPSPDVVAQLAAIARQYQLTYTVHLPYDVKAGSPDEAQRQHAVDTWQRVICATCALPVHGFIVHLEPENYHSHVPAANIPLWTAQVRRSLSDLRSSSLTTIDPSLICVETLGYDLMPFVPDILANGFSLTLDVGHLWLNGYYSPSYVRQLLPHTRVIHLHGVQNNTDHQSLVVNDQRKLIEFLTILSDYTDRDMVVTLEVFSDSDFQSSVSLLKTIGAF